MPGTLVLPGEVVLRPGVLVLVLLPGVQVLGVGFARPLPGRAELLAGEGHQPGGRWPGWQGGEAQLGVRFQQRGGPQVAHRPVLEQFPGAAARNERQAVGCVADLARDHLCARDDDLLVRREHRLASRGEVLRHRQRTVGWDQRVAQGQDDRLGGLQALPDTRELERLSRAPPGALDLDEPGPGVPSERHPQPAPLGHRSRHGRGGLLGQAARRRTGDERQPGTSLDNRRPGWAGSGAMLGAGYSGGLCHGPPDRRVHLAQLRLQRRGRAWGDDVGVELHSQLLLLRLEFPQLLLVRAKRRRRSRLADG